MKIEYYLEKLKAIDQRIRLKCTGNPEQFSFELGISKRTLYRYLDYMKDLGADIAYDIYQQSFYYTKAVRLDTDIRVIPLDKEALAEANGGGMIVTEIYFKNFCSVTKNGTDGLYL